MAKATVQAALGPVAMRRLQDDPNATAEDRRHADIILTICVLSIVVTAPIGAILISLSGSKLLTKTKQLHVVEGANSVAFVDEYFVKYPRLRFVLLALGWRRSHRPSLYDISIIDEVEERDDAEDPDGASTDGKEAEKEEPISANNAVDEKSKEASRGVPLPVYSSVTK